MLLDFKELVGPHSGDNMADKLFDITAKYGLKGKVLI
jgi:hypothetical protein